MLGTEKIRNVLRGLAQRYGTESLKRRLWNHEYRNGRWDCLNSMSDDIVYEHIENHAKSGDILDLGCGPGAVGVELKGEAYRSYTGVDICDVAIERARSRGAQSCRADKNAYAQADILTYTPRQDFDVIFFGDSIYYFSWQKVTEILERYAEHLKKNGVFIVRSWTLKEKHRNLVSNIEKSFKMIEKHAYERGEIVVLIFRPRESSKELPEPGALQ